MTEEEIAYANAVTLNPCETLREQLKTLRVKEARIAKRLKKACCELAGFFVEQDYLAPLDRGGDIASLGVDVISIAYNGTAPAETVFPSLSGLLAGLGTVCTGKGGGIMEVGRG